MPFANLDGHRIHYERYGEIGDPIVFVHGYTGDTTDWQHQVAAFSDEYRVLVLDNRGHGESEAPTDHDAYSVDAMVEDTKRVVEEVGFDRYHLVGHSIGGAIAQEIALSDPERVLTLTLEDTSPWFGDHDEAGGTRPYVSPEDMRIAAERVSKMSRDALAGGWKGLLGWSGAADRLHAIGVPTLIVYGSRDASRIREGSQKLAELIPNANLVEIEDAGHSPQREKPDAFNAALRKIFQAA